MEIAEAQRQILDKLASKWGLLTVGDENDYNTMTIAWGQTGNMWWKPVVCVYVTPDRYTHSFMERNDWFTVSLYGDQYRDDLQILGSKSGRDGDKVALTKLTPKPVEHGMTFEEAELTVVCHKLYEQPLEEARMPQEVVKQYYQDMSPHDLYIGEIVSVIE